MHMFLHVFLICTYPSALAAWPPGPHTWLTESHIWTTGIKGLEVSSIIQHITLLSNGTANIMLLK